MLKSTLLASVLISALGWNCSILQSVSALPLPPAKSSAVASPVIALDPSSPNVLAGLQTLASVVKDHDIVIITRYTANTLKKNPITATATTANLDTSIVTRTRTVTAPTVTVTAFPDALTVTKPTTITVFPDAFTVTKPTTVTAFPDAVTVTKSTIVTAFPDSFTVTKPTTVTNYVTTCPGVGSARGDAVIQQPSAFNTAYIAAEQSCACYTQPYVAAVPPACNVATQQPAVYSQPYVAAVPPTCNSAAQPAVSYYVPAGYNAYNPNDAYYQNWYA